jgi:ribonuclease E
MRLASTALAALAAAFVLAVPAYAQARAGDVSPEAPVCSGTGEDGPATCSSGDSGTVGQGTVVTDPADEVDGPGSGDDEDTPDAAPQRGELHVLGAATASSSPQQRAQPASSTAPPAPAPAPAQPAADPAPASHPAPVSEAAARRPASSRELPFTGVNAGLIALMGAVLLGSGLALRARLERLSS